MAAGTEALKHNFMLRGLFDKRGYFNLDQMTPAEYRSSKILDGHSYERIWLRGDELFTAGPGGKAELSQEGQRQLDDAMTAPPANGVYEYMNAPSPFKSTSANALAC